LLISQSPNKVVYFEGFSFNFSFNLHILEHTVLKTKGALNQKDFKNIFLNFQKEWQCHALEFNFYNKIVLNPHK